jgi:hypothetical protein
VCGHHNVGTLSPHALYLPKDGREASENVDKVFLSSFAAHLTYLINTPSSLATQSEDKYTKQQGMLGAKDAYLCWRNLGVVVTSALQAADLIHVSGLSCMSVANSESTTTPSFFLPCPLPPSLPPSAASQNENRNHNAHKNKINE